MKGGEIHWKSNDFLWEYFALLLSHKMEEARKLHKNAFFLPQAYFTIDLFFDKEDGEIMFQRKVF
jgi:hypothetical protein